MSGVAVMCQVARGRKGAPATATIWRFPDGVPTVIETIEADTAKEARRLGKLAVRKHLRIAILLS